VVRSAAHRRERRGLPVAHKHATNTPEAVSHPGSPAPARSRNPRRRSQPSATGAGWKARPLSSPTRCRKHADELLFRSRPPLRTPPLFRLSPLGDWRQRPLRSPLPCAVGEQEETGERERGGMDSPDRALHACAPHGSDGAAALSATAEDDSSA